MNLFIKANATMRRNALLTFLVTALTLPALAQDTQYPPRGQQIPVPDCLNLHSAWDGVLNAACSPYTHERWLRDIQHWRSERLIRIAYDPTRYTLPALLWTQSSFIQPQMMVHDRYFYDPIAGRYTVDRYVDDLVQRYGCLLYTSRCV